MPKESITAKSRRIRPLYTERGYELNWNPHTKKFSIWKLGEWIFADAARGCAWDAILRFRNDDVAFDVSDIEANIKFLNQKISKLMNAIATGETANWTVRDA